MTQTPFAGFCDDDAVWPELFGCVQKFCAKRACFAGILYRPVENVPTKGAQLVREVAHRRKDERDLFLVVPHIGGFGIYLSHQNSVEHWVTSHKARQRRRQLIAQNKDDISCRTVFPFRLCHGRVRQF